MNWKDIYIDKEKSVRGITGKAKYILYITPGLDIVIYIMLSCYIYIDIMF